METVLENFMTIEQMVDIIAFDETSEMLRDRNTEADHEAHMNDFFTDILHVQFEILAFWRKMEKGSATETHIARKIGYYAMGLMGILIRLRDNQESCFTKTPLSDYQRMYARQLSTLIVNHLEKLHIEANTGPVGIGNVKDLSTIADGTNKIKINGVKLYYVAKSGEVRAVRTEFD